MRVLVRSLVAFVSTQRRSLVIGAVAVFVAACADLGAGASLGAARDRIADVDGLLILIPSAIAARGATFGAFGARIGTAIHLGQYDPSLSRKGWLWNQLLGLGFLTLLTSVWAALLSALLAPALGVGSVDLAELLTISVLGGIVASVVLVVVTVSLSRVAHARSWDMDDVGAPTITATGDLVSIPALLLVAPIAQTADVAITATALGISSVLLSGLFWWLAPAPIRTVIAQSSPVLLVAALFSVLAGIVAESRSELFTSVGALLILFPAFMAMFGALGGILSSRLTSKLHLGQAAAQFRPSRSTWPDIALTIAFALGVFVFLAVGTAGIAEITDVARPPLPDLIGISAAGGMLGTLILVFVAHTAATTSFRLRLDPDNVAIPIVTSVMDFAGMLCLALALAMFGIS